MSPSRALLSAYHHLRWLWHRLRYGSAHGRSYFEFREQDFDRRHGIETAAWIEVADLDVPADRKELAAAYIPTYFGVFPGIVRSSGIDPRQFTFVDLGSGKGRMLILAAEAGFARALGVELSGLHEVAVRNIEAYTRKTGTRTKLEARHQDVCEFEFPAGPLFVFYFNAFFGSVLDAALDNLRAAVTREKRPVFFVWFGTQYFPERRVAETLAAQAFLQPVQRGPDYIIYRAG